MKATHRLAESRRAKQRGTASVLGASGDTGEDFRGMSDIDPTPVAA